MSGPEIVTVRASLPEDPDVEQPAEDELNDHVLSFDDIYRVQDLETRKIPIPEWKGSLMVRVLSASEAIEFQTALRSSKVKQAEAWVDIVARCAMDENGKKLFDSPNRVKVLKEKSTPVFMRLQRILGEMNGFQQPVKNWETVERILREGGTDEDVIARVQQRWREDDEAPLKNA